MLNKRLITTGILGLVLFSMVGCGSNNTDTSINDNEVIIEEDIFESNTEQTVISQAIDRIKEEVTDIPMYMELNDEILEISFQEGLADLVEDFGGLMPMMQSTTEVSFFKVKEGKMDEVKAILEERKAMQELSFENYLIEQYDIIQAGEIFEEDNYIYFIAAEPENFEMMKTIIEDSLSNK